MSDIHSTFRSALDRMNEDSSFIYSFATPPVFEWIKRIAKTEVILENGDTVPLSRRKYNEVNLAFIDYFKRRLETQ